VNEDTRDFHLRRVTGCRDRDANERAWFIYQAVTFGRRLVAQSGIRSGAEQGGPEQRLARGLSREGRVYTPLEPLPPAVTQSAVHRLLIDA
jgi:hypothetical protein